MDILIGGSGILSFCATAATTTITALLAAALTGAKQSPSKLAIAATAVDAISLGCLTAHVVVYLWRQEEVAAWTKRRRWMVGVAVGGPSLLAAALTLATLIITQTKRATLQSSSIDRRAIGLIVPAFVVWAFLVLFQLCFLPASMSTHLAVGHHRSVPSHDNREVAERRHSTLPPTDLNVFTQEMEETSSSPSSPSAKLMDPVSTLRFSLQKAIHPVSSKTRLLVRSTSTQQEPKSSSDTHSFETSSQDGFDTWDTSSVEADARDTVRHTAPSRGTQLEPIPGSRPASPARALDGPFPASDPPLPPQSIELPPRSQSFTSFTSPPPSSRPGSRPGSRRPSRPTSAANSTTTLNEAHIHPLFRTDSPTPPPTALPGTIVTASPFGGQVASPRLAFVRKRSESRPNSPSPLALAKSLEDLRDEHNRARLIASQPSGSRTRTPSPPSREMTPPIPEFILSADPRGSLISYGTRKLGSSSGPETP